MAYCDQSDVARYNLARGTYTATSKPNATQVFQFIAEIAGEIDTTLRMAGYLPPISGSYSTDYAFLRGVNAVGAAWKVEVASETSDNEGMYKTMYQSALKMMANIELESPKDSAQALFRHGFDKGPLISVASHATFLEN